jgi:hypothetical protein
MLIDLKGMNSFIKNIFVKKSQRGERMKVKIRSFVETTHETVAITQIKFGKVKDHGDNYKFYLYH